MLGLSWVAERGVDLHTCQNLTIYIEDLTGFIDMSGPDGLNSHITLWRFSLWNSSHCGNSGPNVHSKDRGGGVQFSHSVMSDHLQPLGLQHTRLPCPTPTPGACSNSCPQSVMPSNHLILLCPLLLPPSIFPSIRVFSNKSVLYIRWPKSWSFSFSTSTSNEYSGLISFRMDCLDLLAVQRDSWESSPTPQFKSINSLALSFLYSPTLTTIHDYWKNHSFD